MDPLLKQRELFFNNLLILGFDKAAVEKEYRVTIDKNVFCLPNQKMFEVITYFLFSKLNELEKQKYPLQWPLLDKNQHTLFRKSCFNYLSNLAQESKVRFPRIVPSLLSTFSGDRFYELYLAFSTHVVERTIRKNDNVLLISRANVTQQNRQDALETLKIATILSVEKLQEIQEYSSRHFQLLLQCSRFFLTNIRNLKANHASSCTSLKEKKETLFSYFPADQNCNQTLARQDAISNLQQYEQKVRNLWKELEGFLTREKSFWNCLGPAVEEDQEKFYLDGAGLDVAIPSTVKQQCPEIEEMDSLRSEEEGKICLLKYLKLLKSFSEFYNKVLMQGDLLQMRNLSLKDNTPDLKENLDSLKVLNEKFSSEIIKAIRETTVKLDTTLHEKQTSEDLKAMVTECPSWDFISAEFQDKIATSRLSSFANGFADASRSSLTLGNNVTHDMEETIPVLSLNSFKSTPELPNRFQYEDCVSILPVEISLNQNSNSQEDINFPTPKKTMLEDSFHTDVNIDETFDFGSFNHIQENPEENNLSTLPSKFQKSDFEFAIASDPSDNFKMRESWLNEEAINSMTLPDTSFLD